MNVREAKQGTAPTFSRLVTSFNIGIGGGALIGALLLDHFGLGVLSFMDVAVVVVGILLILVTNRLISRRGLLRPLASRSIR